MKIAIIYGSTTGNTESAAKAIAGHLQGAVLFQASEVDQRDMEDQDLLILASSTWGLGDLQDDWEGAIGVLENANLSGKKAAFFGLGDQAGYPDTFVDAIGSLHDAAVARGAEVVGRWPADGYDFTASAALEGDSFYGLVLDEENQGHLSPERIAVWAEQLRSETGI